MSRENTKQQQSPTAERSYPSKGASPVSDDDGWVKAAGALSDAYYMEADIGNNELVALYVEPLARLYRIQKRSQRYEQQVGAEPRNEDDRGSGA